MKNRKIKKRLNNQGFNYLSGKSKIILGFVFIFVAFTLTTIVVFNQNSYAVDSTSDGAQDEITLYRKNDNGVLDYVGVKCDSDTTCGFTEEEQTEETYANYLHLPVMFDSKNSDSRNPLFCIESNVELDYDATSESYSTAKYDYAGLINDYGILYILNKSLYFGGDGIIISSFDENFGIYKETYGTQAALWLYLYNTRYNNDNYSLEDKNNHKITSYSYKKLTKGNRFKTYTDDTFEVESSNYYDSKIKKVVEDAVAYANKKKNSKSPITVSVSGNIFEVEGTDYCQTDKINVTGDSEMESFSITAKGVDGLFFVDKDGKKIDDTTNILPGKELYIRFPKKSVPEKKQKIDIVVNGSFSGLLAYKYTKQKTEEPTGTSEATPTVVDLQTIVLGSTNKRNISVGTSIDVIGAPNTSKTRNYIIIILGTVILIGGISLIIINRKKIIN